MIINIARYLQVKTNLSRISYIYVYIHTHSGSKTKRLHVEGIVNFKYNRNVSLFLSEFYKNNFKTWYVCICVNEFDVFGKSANK